MGDSWKEMKFGDCGELVRDTCQPDESYGKPYIGLEHIEQGTLRLNSIGIAEDVTSTKNKFKSGDILFGKLRPYFRKVVRPMVNGICSTDIWVVRAKDGVDQGFLFYWMASKEFVDIANQGSEGTKMPRAKWDFVTKIEQEIPLLPEQKAISSILGALDDKIELNRKMNETLEAMARAIFKSWFVDFDPIPGIGPHKEWQDSLLGKIPKGWRVGRVANLGEIICGKTPPTADPENYGDDMLFITIPDIHNQVFIIDTAKKLSSKGIKTQPNKTLPALSVCVSCIATPSLVALTSESSQTNQQINSVLPYKELSPYYCYMALKGLGLEIKMRGSGGSVTLNLNKTQFAELPVLLPNNLVITKFHESTESIFNKMLLNAKQSRTLAAIRDTLLPKLLSGEISVKRISELIKYDKMKNYGLVF